MHVPVVMPAVGVIVASVRVGVPMVMPAVVVIVSSVRVGVGVGVVMSVAVRDRRRILASFHCPNVIE
jgi:hypothetical protein